MEHWANTCSECPQLLLIKLYDENELPGRKKSPHVSHLGLMSVGFALEQAEN